MNKKMGGGEWEELVKDGDGEEYIGLVERRECVKGWEMSGEVGGGDELGRYSGWKGIVRGVSEREGEYGEMKGGLEGGLSEGGDL